MHGHEIAAISDISSENLVLEEDGTLSYNMEASEENNETSEILHVDESTLTAVDTTITDSANEAGLI